MPKVTMPDGSEVEMPDNVSPELGQRLRAYISAQHGEQEKKPEDPNRDINFQTGNVNKGIAGALGAPVDIAQDVVNLGKAAVGTVAGMAGKPDLMPEVKTDAVGGSKWFEDLMRQHGMITDAAKPRNTAEKIAASVLQMGGNVAGGAVAPEVAIRAAGKVENLVKRPPAMGIIKGDDPRVETMRELRKDGYVFPPSQANPSAANRVIEGAASKRATAQEMSIKNQEISNSIAKKDLKVSPGTPLSPKTIELVKDDAALSYDKVRAFEEPIKANGKYLRGVASLNGEFSALEKKFPGLTKDPEVDELRKILSNETFVNEGMSASEAIDLTRLLRNKATANFKTANGPGGNPEKLALAQAQRDAAAHVEDLLSDTLKRAGKEKLYREWTDARKSFAIAHDVESVLNPATGDISEAGVAGLARKGRPLTGGLAKIAKYSMAFPKGAQAPEKIGGVPESLVDMFITSIGATAGGHAAGVGGGIAGAMAGMAARPTLRKMLMSDLYQDNFVVPKK